MSREEKLIEKLKAYKITPRECYALLKILGYKENNKGKTSGSRIAYTHDNSKTIILHKAHGRDLMYRKECENIIKILEDGGLIWSYYSIINFWVL